jgi:hypothetical protein
MQEKSLQISHLSTFPELVEETNELIEASLGYRKEEKFAVDFAPMALDLSHRFILQDAASKKVLGHVGVRVVHFIWKGETYPCAMLGGICIDKNWRGEGLFSLLFDFILKKYFTSCVFFLLWSEKNELYAKFDFQLGGKQWCYKKLTFNISPASIFTDNCVQKTSLKNLCYTDFKKIMQLYREKIQNQYFSPLRDEEGWNLLKKVESADLYLLRDDQKNITSYMFIGKGMDLDNIAHDGAHAESLGRWIYHLPEESVLWTAERDFTLNSDENILTEPQYLGLWRVNHHKMALQKLSRLLNTSVDFVGEKFKFTHQKNTYTLSPLEMVEAVFDGEKYSFSSIPVYVGGLDSI